MLKLSELTFSSLDWETMKVCMGVLWVFVIAAIGKYLWK
jgi:hypothetical protein